MDITVNYKQIRVTNLSFFLNFFIFFIVVQVQLSPFVFLESLNRKGK